MLIDTLGCKETDDGVFGAFARFKGYRGFFVTWFVTLSFFMTLGVNFTVNVVNFHVNTVKCVNWTSPASKDTSLRWTI